MEKEYLYLAGKVQEALARDGRSGALDVRIMIAGGKLHLTGEVPSEERRNAIAQVAAETAPELEVRNELTVMELGSKAQPEAVDD